MSDHADINERQQWNAFKKAYRKSHPHEKRDTKYYEYLRKLYRDRNEPNLKPWLKMSSSHPVPMTEQELIDLARTEEVQTPLTDAERAEACRARENWSATGQTLLAALSDSELLAVQNVCEKVVTEQIHREMGDSYQNVQQLRDYLEYLRHQSNCPPDIIASIQQEIFKLTLI